jgi:ActR/RegA family two-component response regulator
MNAFATLIVEDTKEFQEIYARAVARQGRTAVIASSYEQAIEEINRRMFAVAIIDVRLSEEDQSNADGLRLISFFSEIGDATNLVLITGYGSFKVAREAFQQYQVFAGLEKAEGLSRIESTIQRAYDEFITRRSNEKIQYSHMLTQPDEPIWRWEDRVLRACLPKDGAAGLYRFFESFFANHAPLINWRLSPGCMVDENSGIVMGAFWSRMQGQPVLVAFGSEARIKGFVSNDAMQDSLRLIPGLGRSRLGPIVKKIRSDGVSGVMRVLLDEDFSGFITHEDAP